MQAVAAIAGEDEHGFLLHPLFFFGQLHRKLPGRAMERAAAESTAGAFFTFRRPVGAAQRGTQFHQCLRKRTRFSRVYRFQRRSHRLFLRWQVDGCGILRQP